MCLPALAAAGAWLSTAAASTATAVGSAAAAATSTTAATAATLSAAGTLAGGVMQYQMGEYQQKVQNQNAQRAQQVGYDEELMQRDKARRALGSQVAALAGQGDRIDTGTPLLLLGESARNAELDALALRRQGIDRADGYRAQGAAAAAEGRNALFGSGFSAASKVLGSKPLMAALGNL